MAFATMLASRWYNMLLLALINPFGPFLFSFMLSLFSSILLGAWDLDVSVSWCLAITVSLDYISSCWVAAGKGWDAITEGFATSPQLWVCCAEDAMQPVTPSALARSSATEPPFIITCAHQGTSRAALHLSAVPHLWWLAMNTNSYEYMDSNSPTAGEHLRGELSTQPPLVPCPAQRGRRDDISHQVPSIPHFCSKSSFKSQIKKRQTRRIILKHWAQS